MIPILLVSSDTDKSDQYITSYIGDHNIDAFNVYIYEPEKKEFSIDQVRAIKRLILTQPSSRRLIVFKFFDTASAEAQNALLKTLEEKTLNNQFILVVQNPIRILTTIQSRSHLVKLEDKKNTITSDIYSHFFEKISTTSNLSFLGDQLVQSITRENAIDIFDKAIIFNRNNFTKNTFNTKIIKKAFEIKNLLQNNNLNPQLALDSFLIFWKKNLPDN